MSKILTKQEEQPSGQCSDTIQYSSDARVLPKPIQGRCFMKNLPPKNYFLESVDYSPSFYLLIPRGKHSRCVRLGDSAPSLGTASSWQLSPSLPASFQLLSEMASPLALETSSNTTRTVIRTSIFSYWPDETAGKALTKYWVGQTVCSGFSITQTNRPTQKQPIFNHQDSHKEARAWNKTSVQPTSSHSPNLLPLNGCFLLAE